MVVRKTPFRPVMKQNIPNAMKPSLVWRFISERILLAGAVPHALPDNCQSPTQRRGTSNGPSLKCSIIPAEIRFVDKVVMQEQALANNYDSRIVGDGITRGMNTALS